MPAVLYEDESVPSALLADLLHRLPETGRDERIVEGVDEDHRNRDLRDFWQTAIGVVEFSDRAEAVHASIVLLVQGDQRRSCPKSLNAACRCRCLG